MFLPCSLRQFGYSEQIWVRIHSLTHLLRVPPVYNIPCRTWYIHYLSHEYFESIYSGTSSQQGHGDTFCTWSLRPNGADRLIWWYLLWRKRGYSMGRVRCAGARKWKVIFEQELENSEWIRETFGGRMFLTGKTSCAKALRQRVPGLLEALVRLQLLSEWNGKSL